MLFQSGTNSEYLTTLTSAVPTLTVVRLYRETWEEKITVGHPEVNDFGMTGVLNAVAAPTCVYRSATRPDDSFVFVASGATFRGDPLHVPVKLVDGTSGRVTSAYFRQSSPSWQKLWETQVP